MPRCYDDFPTLKLAIFGPNSRNIGLPINADDLCLLPNFCTVLFRQLQVGGDTLGGTEKPGVLLVEDLHILRQSELWKTFR